MDDTTANSILHEGIYYADIEGKITDLYKLTYNPDNPELFDIECLTDTTSECQFHKAYCIEKFNYDKYYDPCRQLIVSYKDGENVNLLIDVIHRYYSNIVCGISSIKPTHTRPTRMYLNLLSLLRTRNHHRHI